MDFELKELVLGTGSFSKVRLAVWRKQPCAAKLIFITRTEYNQELVDREINIHQQLRHPHIVQFLGDIVHDDLHVILVELAEEGSLQDAIQDRRLGNWETKKRIAQGITRGLVYIHGENVLHRDLKSANVLLDSAKKAKICDFGLSVVKSTTGGSSSGMRSAVGTTRWMAPELFTLQPKYTTKSDMYALGCIMWEMAADTTPPFKDEIDTAEIARRVKDGEREEIPTNTPVEYRSWIERCWSQDPMERPEAFDIVSEVIDLETYHRNSLVHLSLGIGTGMFTLQPSIMDDTTAITTTTTTTTTTENTVQGDVNIDAVSNHITVRRIHAIGSMLPYVKFYRRTVGKLFHDCKDASNRYDWDDEYLVEAVHQLSLLVIQLSTSGLALLISISAVSSKIDQIRCLLTRLSIKQPRATVAPAATSNNTTAVATGPAADSVISTPENTEQDEIDEKKELEEVQNRLKKYRSSTDKLFREYKIKPDDLRRFVLPESYLEWNKDSKTVARDDISETFEGEIVSGPLKGKQVHVKRLKQIEGGSTEDIIRRTIFLTHVLRSCENIVRPRFVVMPNLILWEPTSLKTSIVGYPLDHARKIDVALKIAGALALVHSFNIVHRDVRAANVIMSPTVQKDGTIVDIPKLTGFEVCRHIRYDYSLGSVTKRTVWHAPERVSWHGTSFKTDVFAFGVLMYEISMGKEPVMKGTNIIQADVQDWIFQEQGHISEDYSNLMRQCLEIDYPRRPEMLQVLERLGQIAAFEYQSASQ
ncbi:hypothetical protein BGZ73_000414 [Actinomortierella ambigua]|nr:hypothetical protein BGZ73_000414 [Actinomortierella ambigua]